LFIFKYVIGPVKMIYNGMRKISDILVNYLEKMERNGFLEKNDRYKIIFVLLFLCSIYFVLNLMTYLYDAFKESVKFNQDDFNMKMTIFIILYAICSTIYNECSIDRLVADAYNPTRIVFLILTLIILIIISTLYSWMAVFLVCLLIFLMTVIPIMFTSKYGFEIFRYINYFCDNPVDMVDKDLNDYLENFEKTPQTGGGEGGEVGGGEKVGGEGGKVRGGGGINNILNFAKKTINTISTQSEKSHIMSFFTKNMLNLKDDNPIPSLAIPIQSPIQSPEVDACNSNISACKMPKQTTLLRLLRLLIIQFYKNMFEITFIILFIRQLFFYCIFIDNYYIAFKFSLILICVFFIAICFTSIISTMVNGKNLLNEYIGTVLRLFAGLIVIGLLISYSKVFYNYIIS